MQREGYDIGLGLANLITVFAAEKIALGGGVMKSSTLFMDAARALVRDISNQAGLAGIRCWAAWRGRRLGSFDIHYAIDGSVI
jgi:predicted NBD/HSP70 family sugar kinase